MLRYHRIGGFSKQRQHPSTLLADRPTGRVLIVRQEAVVTAHPHSDPLCPSAPRRSSCHDAVLPAAGTTPTIAMADNACW